MEDVIVITADSSGIKVANRDMLKASIFNMFIAINPKGFG